ncbi:MAG: hypothetical protein ABGX15_06835 [Paracoccaceae bacterium]
MKPELILHPGFPKCGTTSLQKLFIVENHAFGKAMGIRFIGADFKPDNGYPPVSKLMYDPEACIEAILGNDYPPGRYFLSNEALSNRPEFIQVLARRFTLSRAVFTLRFPALQGVSNYRYSGWLEKDFAGFLDDQGDRLYAVETKYRPAIRRYVDAAVPLRVCPIEETSEAFETRFLRAAFDTVPDLLSKPPFSTLERSNTSVPFAFADALHHELKEGGFAAPKGPERHALVIAAQNYALPEELRAFAPASVGRLDGGKVATAIESYAAFLREFDTPDAIVSDAVAFSHRQVERLTAQPVAGDADVRGLREHARKLLSGALAPAAAPARTAAPASTPATTQAPSATAPAPTPQAPAEDAGKTGWTPLPIKGFRLSNTPRFPKNGLLNFTIMPGKPQICRLRLDGDFSALGRTTVLKFDFRSPTFPLMPDIVAGDAGFPSITLVNEDGVHFSFARGNLKDFFDISRPNTRQGIELPLSAFLYDKDMASNPPLKRNFFASKITAIYFDFLRKPDETIDLEIGNFASREAREIALPPVQDLVVFDRNDQARGLPKFASERGSMGFRVALNATGLVLGYSGATLNLRVLRNGTEMDKVSVTLSAESGNINLRLRDRGAYRIEADLSKDGHTVARETWSACHVVPRDGTRPSSVLGISDAAEYDRIALAGGSWDRLVMSLNVVTRDEAGGFRFHRGLDALPRTRRAPGQKRILSTFQMPKPLSRFPDRWDYNRYGPADPEAYGEVIGWLAKSAQEAGFTHFEVWNEASAYGHWADDMETLIALHKLTHETIQREAPGMVVLGGCTHSWDMDFLRRFFEAGGSDHCDGLTIHGYTYQPALLPQRFDEVEALIDRHVAPDRAFGLHVTEVGFRMPAFSEIAAAENLALFTLEAASRERSRAVVWFRYNNPRPEVESGYQQRSSTGYALVGNGDRYCRASYAAYRFTDLLLGESERVEASGTGEDRLYRIIGAPGTVALAARSRAALEKAAPPPWRRMDSCGGPLGDRETGTLFLALRPGFFV